MKHRTEQQITEALFWICLGTLFTVVALVVLLAGQ